MRLRKEAVERIVMRLQGTYGQQFAGKFSRKEEGVDVGVEMFKESLAVELAGFDSDLHAIGYAMANLPADHVPNAIQLREICRKAPQKQAKAIEYKPTAEDMQRSREMAERASKAVRSHVDPMHCWLHPRSQIVADYLFDAKKHAQRFPRLAQIFDQLVSDGICSEGGKLISRWDGSGWVKA